MKVTLQHLTKKFPNRNKKAGGDVVAVNDFTFEIPDGKLIGLPLRLRQEYSTEPYQRPAGAYRRPDLLW